MEPRGSLLIPPDYNVGVTDWERSMRLRDGRWAVLDSEPEVAGVSKALESTSSSSSGGRQVRLAWLHREARGNWKERRRSCWL
jgi:hypothetical protein